MSAPSLLHNSNNNNGGGGLVSRILSSPHGPLLLAQVIGSFNSIISRAAFSQLDKSSVPSPLTFGVWRTLIAATCLTVLRCFLVRIRSPLDKIKSDEDDEAAMAMAMTTGEEQTTTGTLRHVIHNNQQQQSASSPTSPPGSLSSSSSSPSSSVPSVAAAAAITAAERTKTFWLSTPAPHPPIKSILQVCGLGAVVLTLNFAFFFFGVAFTDAITLAAMMCMIPPICFVLGYLLGMETFTLAKALSTLLVVFGNFIMAHAWRIVLPAHNSDHVIHPHVRHMVLLDASKNNDNVQLTTTASQLDDGNTNNNDSSSPSSYRYHLGVLLLFLCEVMWSLYLLLQRSLVQSMHVVDFLFYLYWSACAGLLCISVVHPQGENVFRQVIFDQLSAFAWFAIFYAGCVQSVLTYFLVSYGTCKANSSLIAALYNGLMPLFVVVEAVLVLGETMDHWQIVGGLVVIAGLVSSLLAIAKEQGGGGGGASDGGSNGKGARDRPV